MIRLLTKGAMALALTGFVAASPLHAAEVCPGPKPESIVVNASGGAMANAMRNAFSADFENIHGIKVIDTSPTPSTLHALIYLATHYILYPTEVTYLSFDGLVASIQSTTGYSEQKKKSGLEEIKLTGIIPTKYRHNLLEHQEKYNSLKKGFGDLVWPPMPMSVVWEESLARRRSIFSYAYDHPAARYHLP